ncbi:hypothetical protein LA080_003463 [Diaporthe eres]|nr:hypothetical protein LA080_003463 [Diaporthe eres]
MENTSPENAAASYPRPQIAKDGLQIALQVLGLSQKPPAQSSHRDPVLIAIDFENITVKFFLISLSLLVSFSLSSRAQTVGFTTLETMRTLHYEPFTFGWTNCDPRPALGGGNEVCFVLGRTRFDLGFDVFIKAADSAVDPRSLPEWELHSSNTSNSDVQQRGRY